MKKLSYTLFNDIFYTIVCSIFIYSFIAVIIQCITYSNGFNLNFLLVLNLLFSPLTLFMILIRLYLHSVLPVSDIYVETNNKLYLEDKKTVLFIENIREIHIIPIYVSIAEFCYYKIYFKDPPSLCENNVDNAYFFAEPYSVKNLFALKNSVLLKKLFKLGLNKELIIYKPL